MESHKNWLKFIISGKIDDYISYKNNCQKQEIYGGGQNQIFNGRPCDKGSEYRG